MSDDHEPIGKDDPVWQEYLRVAVKKDEKLLDSRHKLMDAILVFAGLLSAVNTSFVLDIQQKLDPISTNETTNRILLQLSLQLQSSFNTNVTTTIPLSGEQLYSPIPTITVLGTILYHLSLAFSVLAAAGALLVKVWLLDYEKRAEASGTAYDQSMRRHSAAKGLSTWGFCMVIQVPVILLLVSIFFFLVGFYVSTVRLNDKRVSVVVGVVIILAVDSTVIASVAAELFPDCPYSNPVTATLHQFLGLCWPRRGKLFDYGVVLVVEGIAFSALVMVMMAKSSPDMIWLAFGLLSGWATSTWLLIIRKPIPFIGHAPRISLPLAVTIGTLLAVLPIPFVFIGGDGPIMPSTNFAFLAGLLIFSSIFMIGVFSAIPTGVTPAIHFPKEDTKDKVAEAITSLLPSLTSNTEDRDRVISVIASLPDNAYRQMSLVGRLLPLLSSYLDGCFCDIDGGPAAPFKDVRWQLKPAMFQRTEAYVRCMVAITRDLIPSEGSWTRNIAAVQLPSISARTVGQLQHLAGLTSDNHQLLRAYAKAACMRLTPQSKESITFDNLRVLMKASDAKDYVLLLPHVVATCVSHCYHLSDHPSGSFKPAEEVRLVDYFISQLEGTQDLRQRSALARSVIVPLGLLIRVTGESVLKAQKTSKNSFASSITIPRLWLRILEWTQSSGCSSKQEWKDRLLSILIGQASMSNDPDWIWTMRNSHSIKILLEACLDARLSEDQQLSGLRDVAVLLTGTKAPDGTDDCDFARMHLGKLAKVLKTLAARQALEPADLHFWVKVLLRLDQNVQGTRKLEGFKCAVLELKCACTFVRMDHMDQNRLIAQLDGLVTGGPRSSGWADVFPVSTNLSLPYFWRQKSGQDPEAGGAKVEAPI